MAVRVPGPQRRRTAEGQPGRGPAGRQLHRQRRRHVPAGLGREPVAAAQAAARPARRHRDHAPVTDHLCPPAGRGTGLRPRLGRGISPRHLAAAQPRDPRPDRERPLRLHPAAVAEGPGQALVPAPAGHRAESRLTCPRRPGPGPLRNLARRPGRERRHRGGYPAAARALPRRPACRVRRQETAKRTHREPQRLPHRGPPARMGPWPASQRDDLPRGLPQARGTTAPGARRARHGPDRGSRQPRPVGRSRPPPDHAHPDPVRAARRRRLQAALGLHRPRR